MAVLGTPTFSTKNKIVMHGQQSATARRRQNPGGSGCFCPSTKGDICRVSGKRPLAPCAVSGMMHYGFGELRVSNVVRKSLYLASDASNSCTNKNRSAFTTWWS